MYRHVHPDLGPILGQQVEGGLVQFRSIPYAAISRRFARARLLKELPRNNGDTCFDASQWGPSSIQRLDCIETDLKWNQLPEQPSRTQTQSEDCLRVTLTVPETQLKSESKIPVLAFIHGGALAVASGERYYYDPTKLCADALASQKPLLFVSINYRLGPLGFLHSPEAEELLPPNNGLYDQLLAFEWIREFIAGFGGDPENVTAIGQSAGAASLELHNCNPRKEPLFRQSAVLSGSGSIISVQSPEEHHVEFCKMAKSLGIDAKERPAQDVARELLDVPVESIRDLALHGSFCSETELVPDKDWATMRHANTLKPNAWLKSQIISSCTYDGSISYLVEHAKNRQKRAASFESTCKKQLKHPEDMLNIYGISAIDSDEDALLKIGQVVTDAGFYAPAISMLNGASDSPTESYMVSFDIPNPWPGPLPQNQCASHTWDVVSLLGPYEDQLPVEMREGVSAWRHLIIGYCHGEPPGKSWSPKERFIQRVGSRGLEQLGPLEVQALPAEKLLGLAHKEGGEQGFDHMWHNTVRFYLDKEESEAAKL
ncbi:Para-nitrobenzyl esterase [Cercospora beticola]|uniref:Para-nitrobenzyl esterase n=1 Tax=Cercospora beticola TaxID=122368 RepID=A0A2G5HQK7_CERBT|nr:Para-nitrobenzyl esterase [Cercospora beticola]PIA94522.1 Para-nitrobenzyl esterase [Cercospora beticola]WPB05539.1 hypothetical protein RHO25_010192 [Cercospora beticola]